MDFNQKEDNKNESNWYYSYRFRSTWDRYGAHDVRRHWACVPGRSINSSIVWDRVPSGIKKSLVAHLEAL